MNITIFGLVGVVGVNDNFLNGKSKVQFTLGFVYDGYNKYTDLYENPPDNLQPSLSILYVYENPDIFTFDKETGIEVLVSCQYNCNCKLGYSGCSKLDKSCPDWQVK